ncbi:MAG: class I SAM-dependent methyltransferase [Longimicrobiales bacterium]
MTETFDAEWLDQREPVDHRSRASAPLEPLRAWWTRRRASTVLDLGCGTGSNLRYLAAKLPAPQRWTVVDHDSQLLGRVRTPDADVKVRKVLGDLAVVGLAEVEGSDLVTASALLDLVSADWLRTLVDACVAARSAALFALTYDGTIGWPRGEDADDGLIRDAVNQHQRRDKGIGPALGPDAAPVAEELFRAIGYQTWLLASPWALAPSDAALSRALVDGWVRAASEMEPRDAERIRLWGQRRRAAAAEADFALVVGHLDLLALPPE